MVLSVNGGDGIFSALRNLTQSTSYLFKTQDEISSGLKIGSAKDDGAAFSIAQHLRGEVLGIHTLSIANRAKRSM